MEEMPQVQEGRGCVDGTAGLADERDVRDAQVSQQGGDDF
jgi:hypothetical protein